MSFAGHIARAPEYLPVAIPAKVSRFVRYCGLTGLACLGIFGFSTTTQNANANGETRDIHMVHAHTGETINIVYKRDGSFDSAALEKLNWFLRDWRVDEPIAMSPELFDVIWYVYREVGASDPVKIMSAYRSPGTNAMLRRRSRAVAKESQHMRGNAMDVHIPGVSMAKVREIGMRLQRGGVGYYPSAGSPFVHLDVGSVRSWPRMPREQLERLFPDGKTVHLPKDGIPLANYALAYAEIQARGGSALDVDTVNANRGKSLWALLFGGDEDEDTRDALRGSNTRVARGRAQQSAPPQVAAISSGESVNAWGAPPVVASVPASRVAVASPPAPAGPARSEPVIPAAEAAAQPAARTLEIAGLPAPPIRPRGVAPEQLVATAEPLPPIRPSSLSGLAASLVNPTAIALAPVVGLPVPPARPEARANVLAALPELVARPSEAPSTGLVQSYAAIDAPARPGLPRISAQEAPVVQGAGAQGIRPLLRGIATLPAPAAPARVGGPDILLAALPAADQKPADVAAVEDPNVAREVRREVVALRFSNAGAMVMPGSTFSGGFVRPLGMSFMKAGE